MAVSKNGRLTKIEELLEKHDEQIDVLTVLIEQHDDRMRVVERALDNTERLLVLEGDRIDRLERIESRQNKLFAEISEQLHNRKG